MTPTKRCPNILKCKFCNWQIKKWITTKGGKSRNRFNLLASHVMIEHEEEYLKILDIISNEMPKEERDGRI